MALSRLAQKVLDELVHGPMTSTRLHEIGGKSATRRISELRKAGYDIQRNVYSGDYSLVTSPKVVKTEYATYTCPECGFRGDDPKVIHNALFGVLCPRCGGPMAA